MTPREHEKILAQHTEQLASKIARLSATAKLQDTELKMLRRKVGKLREELEKYRDRSPSRAVVEFNRTGGIL